MKNDTAFLIPVYNDQIGLDLTLNELSNETDDFDVIVVDDGSPEIIKINNLDLNVKLLRLDNNGGIEKALNEGLYYILNNDYLYIARLDAGDINIPGRVSIQKEILKNTNIALVGTWADFIDEHGENVWTYKPPCSEEKIKKRHKYNSAFLHSSVMFKREAVVNCGVYSTEYPAAEDYDFWVRISQKFNVVNLPFVLVKKIVSRNSISVQKRKIQVKSRVKIALHNFELNSIFSYFGLVRNLVLYFMPYSSAFYIKQSLKKIM